jgi:hypothetical protein
MHRPRYCNSAGTRFPQHALLCQCISTLHVHTHCFILLGVSCCYRAEAEHSAHHVVCFTYSKELASLPKK